jgi:integrase
MKINQRGGSWQVSLMRDGKRLRFQFRTKKEAELWAKEAELAIARGHEPARPGGTYAPTGHTIRQAYDLAHQTRWVSLRTTFMSEIGWRVVKELGEDTPVSDLNYERIAGLIQDWRLTGLSQSTINRRLSALSAMLNNAVEMGWIPVKPKIPYGRERKKERRYITQEEEVAILAQLTGKHHALVVMAVDTGLRLSELLNLRWRDLTTTSLSVVKSKNEQARRIPLTSRVRGLLEQMPRDGHGPFSGIDRFNASRTFREAAEKAGIKDSGVVFHSLRHTCASRLVMAGANTTLVKEWMGHKSIATTMLYAHLSPKTLMDAVTLLEQSTDTNDHVRHT